VKIPYVIDNEAHRLADVLRDILAGHAGRSFDVATAYFNVQGFRLLRDGLLGLGSFRLLETSRATGRPSGCGHGRRRRCGGS
jgi:hypothetical protein